MELQTITCLLYTSLKPTTKSNYLYMYDRFIRDTFGKRNIAEIKYSDVVQFYNHLTKKQELKINTLETIHTLLHPTFQLAVRAVSYTHLDVYKRQLLYRQLYLPVSCDLRCHSQFKKISKWKIQRNQRFHTRGFSPCGTGAYSQ